MRALIIVMTVLMLVIGLLPANADGVFVMKQRANIDPASHARDITEPVQKALIIYNKGVEHLILQVSYKGDVSEFAWLVPTPAKPQVTKVDEPVFHWLHQATAPRVRYWFDADQKLGASVQMGKSLMAASAPGGLDVQVIEEKQVGAYDIAVLRAGNADDLLQWLRGNHYQITPKLAPLISDYVKRGWVFTAMRVNANYKGKVAQHLSEGVLQSLKFSFRVSEPIYPLKVSSLNKGDTDILLYVLAAHRVNEPIMTTECSFSLGESMESYMIGDMLWRDRTWPSVRLTKLTAKLAPEQMTHDLVLKQASTDDMIPVKTVSPPFLANLGASSILLMDNSFSYPQSIVILGLTGLVALSPFGRRRWRIWLAAGTIFVIAGIIAGDRAIAHHLADYSQWHGGYEPVGAVSLAIIIIAAGVILSVVRGRRVRKN